MLKFVLVVVILAEPFLTWKINAAGLNSLPIVTPLWPRSSHHACAKLLLFFRECGALLWSSRRMAYCEARDIVSALRLASVD
jgi:hypothetical protein